SSRLLAGCPLPRPRSDELLVRRPPSPVRIRSGPRHLRADECRGRVLPRRGALPGSIRDRAASLDLCVPHRLLADATDSPRDDWPSALTTGAATLPED